MSESSSGSPPKTDSPHRAAPWERRVQEGRSPWKVWVPTYIIRSYGAQLGPHGLSIYLSLAWHMTRESHNLWPSINDVARQVGCSRSTVERALRRLRALSLLETKPCMDAKGQHSNYWRLIDPPEEREQNGSHGAPVAGAVLQTGAPLLIEGGTPSNSQGGAVPQTAPPLLRRSEEGVCEEGDTHTPCAAHLYQQEADEVAQLSAQWCAQLPPGAPAFRDAHAKDIGWWVQALLHRGWTAEQLALSIDEPTRDRGEWPRVWAARMGSPSKQAGKTPLEVVEERQARAEELQRARASLETDEGRAVLAELARRVGRRPDQHDEGNSAAGGG